MGSQQSFSTNLLPPILQLAQEKLQAFATSSDFSDQMALAFGEGETTELQSAWAKGIFRFPTIQLVSSTEINGANGAFASARNTIYLAQEFLRGNTNNLDAVVGVFLEEYGHFVDYSLNSTDSPGDEGAIFSVLVLGETLEESQLQQLQVENDSGRAMLEGEMVEIEQASPFNIEFDYRFDTDGFFNNPERQATLEAAAQVWEDLLQDEFDNVPVGIEFSIKNPQTGQEESVVLNAEIDDLLIFVGSQSPPFGIGGGLAGGGPTGYNAEGTIFRNRVTGSDFEPFAGHISFDPTPSFSNGNSTNWFFDTTPDTSEDLPSGSIDFLETAIHEIGHVLGVGTSAIFDQIGAGASFDGLNALSVNNNSPIPLEADLAHILDGFTLADGTQAAMSGRDSARLPTSVDLAVLADIGYQIEGFQAQGSVPPLSTEANDTIFGTIIDDFLEGLGGEDQIQGNEGNDTLAGNAGNDDLFGQAGDDLLNGGIGADQLVGGDGDDTLNGGDDADSLFGEAGNDLLNGGIGADQLAGGSNDDTLNGGDDADSLFGEAGNDLLNGEADNDNLFGGEGNDLLNGGTGDDNLSGEAGVDTFFFEANNGQDSIFDFDLTTEVIQVAADLGFVTEEEILATLSKPSSTVSRFTLSSSNTIDVFHDSVSGTPLTVANFAIAELPTELSLDIDGNGTADALTDGVLVLRHLFGFQEDTLINGAVANDGTRTTAAEIEGFLGQDSTFWDVDGDSNADALTDGVLILRYLFGFQEETLISGAIAPDATRNIASEVQAYLDGMIPTAAGNSLAVTNNV